MNLLPEGYEQEVVLDEDLVREGPVGYRNGVAFDYERGDFKRDGRNRIMDCNGIESWKSWCINCLATERYKHLAYPTDFGIELDLIFGAESREEAESILTRQITEAILADPYQRTAYIESLEFNWTKADTVEVSAILHGIDEVTIDLVAYITKGA